MDKYFVNISVYRAVVLWLQAREMDMTQLLTGIEVSVEQLSGSDCMLNTAQHHRLIHNLLAMCDRPGLGLSIGATESIGSLGVVGLTMLCAPNLRESMELGVQYSAIIGALGNLEVSSDGNDFIIAFDHPPATYATKRYQVESLFASIYSYIAQLCGISSILEPAGENTSVAATSLHLAYKDPGYKHQYQQFFDCEVVFEAERNQMVFDVSALGQPMAFSNDFAFRKCRALCGQLAQEMKEESITVREVRQHLATDPVGMAKPQRLADAMGMSLRTLQRQLSQCGASVSGLSAETNHRLSLDLLSNPALTLAEISAALGYSDASNFRRAFKSWTGLTPTEFRDSL